MENRIEGLTIFFVNLRNFSQGAGDLCAAIQDCHPDFVGIVETHLDSASIGMYLPPRYAVAVSIDLTCHGGGAFALVDAISYEEFYIVGS